MSRFSFTPRAARDLETIFEYIAEENPNAAFRLLDQFVGKCRLLAHSPEVGRLREELAPSLRSFPVGNYIVFYRPAGDGVDIVRILHGARDIEEQFAP